ncbi:hypothetical protein [Paenibacillus gansuensis]|uniref:Uncharacterized protein n=1 Tax=Paenibacillus gansuensis TaxID=306542 RepID=A0ABW5PFU9_9BACL
MQDKERGQDKSIAPELKQDKEKNADLAQEMSLAEQLMEGEMEPADVSELARKRLLSRTEIRVQAKIDPIVEETRRYRELAKEVDGRYAAYDRFVKGDGEDKE